MPAIARTIWLKDCAHYSYSLVGEKGVEMGKLAAAKFALPAGFVIPSTVFIELLQQHDVRQRLKQLFEQINPQTPQTIKDVAKQIQHLIYHLHIPDEIGYEIAQSYQKLGNNAFVAIRLSKAEVKQPAVHATELNIQGDANVILMIKKVWAGLFQPQLLSYLYENQLTPLDVNTAIMVQAMSQSDLAGVLYTNNPDNNNKRTVVIDAVWGLGEYILEKPDQADRYEIEKNSWQLSNHIQRTQTHQLKRKVAKTVEVSLNKKQQASAKLTDKQLTNLAKLAVQIQQFLFFPQRVEWSIEADKIYILQTQQMMPSDLPTVKLTDSSTQRPILYGSSVHHGLISGKVHLIRNDHDLRSLQAHHVAVIKNFSPHMLHDLKRATAVICDKPVYPLDVQHLGIPVVANTHFASTILKPDQVVTVYGQQGVVYEGALTGNQPTFSSSEASNQPKDEPTFEVYLSTGEPHNIGHIDSESVAGVGLLRAEYVVALLGQHPKALLRQGKEHLYQQALMRAVEKISRHFKDKPVIYRFLDFTAKEMRSLQFGDQYEPLEENPKLGYRGAYRYLTDPQVFDLEIEVIQHLRTAGFNNLHVMVPFIRSVDELILIKKYLAKRGLSAESGLQLWLMIDTPSVALTIDNYLRHGVDGVTIGAQDLLLLLTGLDHTDEVHHSLSYTHDPAFRLLVKNIIEACTRHSKPLIFCEHSMSVDLLRMLAELNCPAVSVNQSQLEFVRSFRRE